MLYPELLQGPVLCGRHDFCTIFSAHHCTLLGVDGMRRRLFPQVEGALDRHRAIAGSELDLSGGYWFESSRRGKTPGQRIMQTAVKINT